MKRIVTFFIFASTLLLLAECKQGRMTTQLVSIDSLLVQDKVDSAIVLLSEPLMKNLRSEADSAYFYLLQVEALYRKWIPVNSDSAIDYSVHYYKGTSDMEKLARAYYYKGVTNELGKNLQEKILLVKKAEKLAEKTDNLLLKHKIYEKLSYYNGNAYEYNLGLFYAKKALHIAKQIDDKNRQAIALCYMAADYSFMGYKDSLAICVQACLPLADFVSDNDKAYLYTRIGELYTENEPELAKKYLQKSIKINPRLLTYLSLSNIYMKEQDVKKAQSLWEEALKIGRDSKSKAEVFKAMREQSMKSRDYQQANNLADSIMKYQNNYYDKREQDRIAEIQAKYDKDAAEKELRSAIQSWGLGIITLLALVFGVLSYMSYRGMKAKKDLNETRWLLESYKKQAEELSASGNVNAKEIMALHKKIDELQQRHSGILAKGKVLYEAIQQGGTTILWKKEDFLNYLEYYKMIDLPFLNKMDTDFDGLSPKYTFFAILEHEGKSDEDLQRILGISESTLRSTRSRINSKRR